MVDYQIMLGNKRFAIAASATATLSYFLLCLSWFDHELFRPPSGPLTVVFFVVFLVSCALLLMRNGIPKPFEDSKDNKAIAAVIGITTISRLPFLAGAYGLFSSDAAVQGIMALHIAEGRHHPVFLYRWSYIGTLKAHLTALLSWVSGEPVLSFTLVAILTYAAFAAAVFALARVVLPRGEAFVASLYIVVAPSFLTSWGMHNEGNYVDVLAFGTAMLVLGSHILREPEGRLRRAFWMGILGGLAFWAHILATYYLLAAILVLVACERRFRRSLTRLAVFLSGFVLGDLPGILWNTTHEWLSFRWWALDQSESSDRVGRTLDQLKGVFTTSLAVLTGWWPTESPPWPGAFWRWALLLVVPACLIYFCFRFQHALRSLLRGHLTPESYLVGFALLVIAVFAQSSFGWMTEEPRYLLFVFSVVPIFLAATLGPIWRRAPWIAGLIVALIVFVNSYGSGAYWLRAFESDAINRKFVRNVESLGVRYGHTDYYISYKYNFLSHGRLAWTTALGPAQTEWYMPYREEAAKAEEVALIPRSYRLARRIGRRLDARGITYRREDLLYPVLYDFSEKVKLEWLR